MGRALPLIISVLMMTISAVAVAQVDSGAVASPTSSEPQASVGSSIAAQAQALRKTTPSQACPTEPADALCIVVINKNNTVTVFAGDHLAGKPLARGNAPDQEGARAYALRLLTDIGEPSVLAGASYKTFKMSNSITVEDAEKILLEHTNKAKFAERFAPRFRNFIRSGIIRGASIVGMVTGGVVTFYNAVKAREVVTMEEIPATPNLPDLERLRELTPTKVGKPPE